MPGTPGAGGVRRRALDDLSTLELLGLIIELVQRLSALVLITSAPNWIRPGQVPHVARLSLSRLTRRHGSAMILGVTGGKMLPAESSSKSCRARMVFRCSSSS